MSALLTEYKILFRLIQFCHCALKSRKTCRPQFRDTLFCNFTEFSSYYVYMVLAASHKDAGTSQNTSPFTSALPGETGKSVQDGSLMSPGAFSQTLINYTVSWMVISGTICNCTCYWLRSDCFSLIAVIVPSSSKVTRNGVVLNPNSYRVFP